DDGISTGNAGSLVGGVTVTTSEETAPRHTGVNYLIKLYDDVGNLAVPLQGPILGDTSGTAVPEGYVGHEIISKVSTDTAFGTSTNYKVMTSITLTPGVWELTSAVYFNKGTIVTTGLVRLAIST